MPDIIQPYVVAALEKDGWSVEEEVQLRLAGHPFSIDIVADRLVALVRETECIAVEVKCFGSKTPMRCIEPLANTARTNLRSNVWELTGSYI